MAPWLWYYNNRSKANNMKAKATARPTAAQLQKEAARAARRAAALERQTDDYRCDAGFVAIYTQEAGK